jgi:hypothetical protein
MTLKKNPITGIPPRPGKPEPESDEYNTAVSSPDDVYDVVISTSKEFSTLEPGRYEAIVNEIVGLPMRDTGGFIRAEFIIADPDPKLMGRRHSVLFQMKQPDGRTDAEWGPVFYHRMMAKLGYPQEKRGKEAREEITKEKPGVYLRITAGKQAGFVNTTVEGRFDQDNDNIEALREWMDSNPY